MTTHITKLKDLTIVCLKDMNKIYEAIDRNARELVAAVVAERQSPLFEQLRQTAADYISSVDALIDTVKASNLKDARIKASDIDFNLLKAIEQLSPSDSELELICQDYAQNPTMLRLIREKANADKRHNLKIPSVPTDKVKAFEKIADFLKGCVHVASDYSSPLRTHQLENVVNNFETAFKNELEVIGG